MMRPGGDVAVYLCRRPVDFRKSINGLSILVEQELERDPFAEALFVFCNRKRDKIKILYFEGSGFVLWYKRLEKDRFAWLGPSGDPIATYSGRELNWLLDGIDIFSIRPHAKRSYESVL
jgi:transposase